MDLQEFKMSIPLDELELKLKLLGQIVDLNTITTTQICKDLKANFDVETSEQEIHLLIEPAIFSPIDEAIMTYKNLI